MADTWRLFVALGLPSEVIEGLNAIQAHLIEQTPPRTVRWVQPGKFHLTLKFLGDSPVAQRSVLQDALQHAVNGLSPFPTVVGGLGCFPNTRRPRVVWAGIQDPNRTLLDLHNAVERAIAPLGYPTEAGSFSPHLTLGRVHRDARASDVQALGHIVSTTTVDDLEPWTVTGVSLMRSDLRPSGAVYTVLCHVPLG